MSVQQTLPDFANSEPEPDTNDSEPADSGADDDGETNRAAFGPDGDAQCANCQRPVNEEIARVLGDNERRVACCVHCARRSNGKKFTKTTGAINNYHAPGETYLVDPEGDE